MSGRAIQTLQDLLESRVGNVSPSIQLSILKDGVEVINGAWGTISGDETVTTATLFDLASLTKLFTTTAFLALASDQHVDIDQPVGTILPEFVAKSPRPIGPLQDPHTEEEFVPIPGLIGEFVDPGEVTFRHLLTHTSGLPPWKNLFRLGRHVTCPAPAAWPQMYNAIVSEPFADSVGANVQYSDLGYMLLGESIARLSDKPLGEALHNLVIIPLELPTLQFNPLDRGRTLPEIAPTEYDRRWRRARCHGRVHDENAFAAGGVAGHAGLFGTATDLARFGQAWLQSNSDLPVDLKLLSQATREQTARDETRRGLGWMLMSHAGDFWGRGFSRNSFGHTGFTGTSLWIDPEFRIVVACLTNRVYYGRDPEPIARFRREFHDAIALEFAAR